MSSKTFLDWFLTKNGRRVSLVVAGAVTHVAFFAPFLQHSMFLDNYRDLIRLYRQGFSVSVPKKLQDTFQQTLELLQIPRIDRPDFQPFMACGFEIFGIGTAYTRYGVRIGIPISFTYENVESIERDKIMVNLESVVWDSDAGKQLLKSLVLSENAQKYAIAREVKLRQSPKFLIDCGSAALYCYATYTLSASLNNKFNLLTKPRSIRVAMYGLLSLLALGQYLMIKDISQVHYEQAIDEELKEKSPIFAQGGKEFYTKILERNIALRTLLGLEGQSTYTALGNENYLLRTRHIPLVQRKQFFEEPQVAAKQAALS